METRDAVDLPLDQLQGMVSEFYGYRDRNRAYPSVMLDMVISVGELSESVRKADSATIPYSLSRMLTNLLQICNKKGISLSKIVWSKYPMLCPFCLSIPCRCALFEVHKPPDKPYIKQPRTSVKPLTLQDLYSMVSGIYGAQSYITSVEHHLLMLYEQISEASIVLERNLNELGSSLADIFVWLMMLSSKLKIKTKDIERAMSNLYSGHQFHEVRDDSFDDLRRLWNITLKSERRLKGKAFEDFAFAFFSMVPSFRVKKNIRTDTSEFDLVIGIDPEKNGGAYWERYQPLIFVECKYRGRTTGQNVISNILGRVLVQDTGKAETLIFVLSKSHFSDEAIQQLRYAYLKGYLIVPITESDIEKILKTQEYIHEFLRELVENTCARVKSVAR